MNANANPATETWQEIQHAVENLGELAKSDLPPQQFFSELSRSLVSLTDAAFCRVWIPEASASTPSWKLIADYAKEVSQLPTDPSQYATLVTAAADAKTETSLPAGSPFDDSLDSKLVFDTYLQRIQVGDNVVAVIQLDHSPGQTESDREATKHLASVGAEIGAEFHRNWHYRKLSDREQRREVLDRFLDSIHRSYDLRRVAHAIVGEGRELLDCDRVSLLTNKSKRRCRVLAVSGVQKPDRRSTTVRCIERLANAKLRETEPLWFEPTQEDSDPNLKKYFTETNARYVGLLPVVSPSESNRKPRRLGTVLVEVFDPDKEFDQDLLQSRSNWMVRHSSNAISNAIHVQRLPFLSISRWLDRSVLRGRRIPWLMLLAIGLFAAIGYFAVMPKELEISARGELTPTKRESVYAPRPGTVIEFPFLDVPNAKEDTQDVVVESGDVLVRLENADLDYELTSLLGEQATVDQQLGTIAASIGQFSGRDPESRKRYDELTAQAAELKVKQASLARRIGLVNKERERLSVKAGINGRILTWDVVNELKLRPVQQGDFLMEIVDLDGPWEIDLFVRDRHIGYVRKAQADAGESKPLSVSFFHRSDPEKKFTGKVKTIAMETDLYPEYGSAVRVTCTIERTQELTDFRPGTTLVANIECGEEPWAYVLCYDLIHTIRLWGLF